MKKWKRLFASALTLILAVLVLGSLPMSAEAASVVDNGYHGFDWVVFDDGTLVISGREVETSGVYSPWLSSGVRITTLKLMPGVTSVDAYAFSDLSSLREVYLPESLTHLESGAFMNCGRFTVFFSGTQSQWRLIDWDDWDDVGFGSIDYATVYYESHSESHRHSLRYVEAQPASCVSAGSMGYWYCSGCGKYFADESASRQISQSDAVVDALGHSWGEWTMTKPATEYAVGQEARTCARCGEKETRELPKLDSSSSVITTVARRSETVSAIINSEVSATAFCAVYDSNGKMLGTQTLTVVEGTQTLSFLPFAGIDFDHAKVFLLDAQGKPLCESKGA